MLVKSLLFTYLLTSDRLMGCFILFANRGCGRYPISVSNLRVRLRLILSYAIINRILMHESNKRNIKIVISIITASVIARILIYYIISK